MSNDIASPQHSVGRIWYVLGGILSVFVGFYAIGRPGMAAIAITQFIGIVIVVSGVFLFVAAVFGRARQHRLLDFFSAALRIIVGLMLLTHLIKGVLALTLILGAVFMVEGVYGLLLGLRLRGKNPAWLWMLINGVAALVLGVMLLVKFPSTAEWAIGLLFGINSIFLGISLITFGSALPRAQEA
jgi:uncharacterized membrane protein HdeD (DUF308 family)